MTSSRPAEQEVEAVGELGSPGFGVRVERPLRHRVALDEEELRTVLGRRPLAEPSLVGGCQVGLAHDALARRRLDEPLRVVEVDARDLVGNARKLETEQRNRAGGALLDGGDHAREHGAQHDLDVAVVADEAELDVERHVLGEVAGGVVRLGAEHRPGLVDALEHADHHLLVQLRALGEDRRGRPK